MTAIEWLNRQRFTHFAINRLGGRRVANAVLARAPLRRTVGNGALRYRCRYLDSITLAEEIFGRRVYAPAVTPHLRTFIDLGCNVGYFPVFLADVTGRRDLRGLAVDADADMVVETSWTLRANELGSVHALHGLVGRPGDSGQGDFFLHPVKIKSSAHAVDEPGRPATGPWRKTRVGMIDLEKEWRDRFGDARCDLLKVDIEGAEAQFLAPEAEILRRVDRIVVEIHKWVTSPEAVGERLATLGFSRKAILEEAPALAVTLYARRHDRQE